MIENIFSKAVRVSIGIVFLVASVITGIVTGYAYDYNVLVTMLATVGSLSILGAIFSVRYIPYMALNLAGFVAGLFVVSMKDALGNLYAILFLAVIFLAMWFVEMLISKKETPIGKIFGGLLINAISILVIVIVTVLVISVSVIMLI